MPSPFPGMDPYLEDPVRWPDLHLRLIAGLAEQLQADLRPRYVVRAEERVYLTQGDDRRTIRPDVAVLEGGDTPATPAPERKTTSPVMVPAVMPQEKRERFLEIRLQATGQVVTAIEVLSPSNKRPGSKGRRLYLRKREELLLSDVHLVEIDLLRTGERVPMAAALPAAHYYVIVSDAAQRPQCEVYPIELRSVLPRVSIPLRQEERIALDLQVVFDVAYERAAYDLDVDYEAGPAVGLEGDDAAWARKQVAEWESDRQ